MKSFSYGIFFGSVILMPWWVSFIIGLYLLFHYDANVMFGLSFFALDILFYEERKVIFGTTPFLLTLFSLVAIFSIKYIKTRLWPVLN